MELTREKQIIFTDKNKQAALGFTGPGKKVRDHAGFVRS